MSCVFLVSRGPRKARRRFSRAATRKTTSARPRRSIDGGKFRRRDPCDRCAAFSHKTETAIHANGAVGVLARARARLTSLRRTRSLCRSTFDRVGRQKTLREASRERARASVGDSADAATGFPSAGRWTSGDDVRDPHPSGASGEMASDAAPALNGQTHANIGADAEVSPATPAVKDRIDRPEVPGTCLSLRILEGTSGSPPRPAAVGTPPVRHTACAAPNEGDARQGSVAPARFFFRFRRFR